jgi:hypothetical protein
MICNSFGIDDIHALRRDFMASCVDALDFGGLFVFLGVKNDHFSPLHLFSDLMDLNPRLFEGILNL